MDEDDMISIIEALLDGDEREQMLHEALLRFPDLRRRYGTSKVPDRVKKLAQKEAVVVVADPQALANDQGSIWLMLLGDLKALYDAYYSAHWRSYGDPYYGDHLMYQRLYNDLFEEIDSVAERALGLTGNDAIVEPTTLLSTEMSCLKALVMPGEFASSMLEAEKRFEQRLSTMLDTLRASAMLSDGTENLLQGIADKHEEHIYLLSRRIRKK